MFVIYYKGKAIGEEFESFDEAEDVINEMIITSCTNSEDILKEINLYQIKEYDV